MATIIIDNADAASLGAYFFTVELDGSDYEFRFQFNAREGFWYFDLLDADGNYIRAGVKVVSNFPVLRTCVATNKFPGLLAFLDTRDRPFDPGLEEFGVEVVQAYDEAS